MSKALEICKFPPMGNLQTAEWINDQHDRLEKGTRLIIQRLKHNPQASG